LEVQAEFILQYACERHLFPVRWKSVDGDDHVCESCDSAAEMAYSSGGEFDHERVQRSNRGPAQHGVTCVVFSSEDIKL